MIKYQAKRFQEILLNEAAGLRRDLHNRGRIAIEAAPEEYERISLADQRELALDLVDRESRRLRDVEAALGRISKSSFGICIDCDEPIAAKRLAALPWASRCVRCQDTADSALDSKEVSHRLVFA